MSFRFMRIMVFFDLPVETNVDKKEYRRFRKFLIKEGFIMMQESVYSKLALNASVVESVRKRIILNKPVKGIVQSLVVTEKQFAGIELIVGTENKKQVDSTERIIIV